MDLRSSSGVEWGVYTPIILQALADKLALERNMSRSKLVTEALKIGFYHIQKGGLFRGR